jgi:cobalt/nickel transport system ATP-binding protein
MQKCIIKTRGLNFSYPDRTHALKDINIDIKKGERVAFVGSNGAGKSTLFLHFNGILRASSGKVIIDGDPVTSKKEELMQIRQKVGLVFQNPDDQLFSPTVEEDVAFGPMNIGLSLDEVDQRVEDALKRVGMQDFKKKAPHHLSGGQKKRVAIAGILAMKPEIMVLDEPTTGLDPYGVTQILKILYELNQEGMTILLTSHDVDMIPLFAHRIFVMHHGAIAAEGTPEEIFSNLELIRKCHLRQPQIADLLRHLQNDGIPVKVKLTVKEAREELLKILKKIKLA